MQVYGADTVWKQLNRERISIARCTVERLMKRLGLQSVRRGKMVRTTVSDGKAPCPLDRVNRIFKADRPNQLWVSDFTYVSTWQGWQTNESVELATLEWISLFNHHRLLEPIGYIPPAETGANYYRHLANQAATTV